MKSISIPGVFLLLLLLPQAHPFTLGPARSTLSTTTSLSAFTLTKDTSRNLHITTDDAGTKLFYDIYEPESSPNQSVMYLPCLSRAKNNAKASNLEMFCKRSNRNFLCADYYGVGRSEGSMETACLTRWMTDAEKLMAKAIPGMKYVLVGAGVGGWIAMLLAKKRPDLVAGVVGLAADPDFTEDLLWAQLSDSDKKEILSKGCKVIDWGDESYPISRALIEDGRENLILRGETGSLPIQCPVRLIHGMQDEEVPYATALKLCDVIATNEIAVTLVKDGKHSLDQEEDFVRMRGAVDDVFSNVLDYDLTSPASG